MTDAVTDIESDTLLEDVEHHFRVQAGPGAGKTYWLVKHIKNVLHRTKRLTPACRVACISYTNVAVNEIRKRLETAADRVETSTIHSFLYRNVVKPYLHLLTDADGKPVVDFKLVDGHDEHRPSYNKVDQWISQLAIAKLRRFFRADRWTLFGELRKTAFQLNADGGRWVIRDSRFPSLATLSSDHIEVYKAKYWSEGVIDHEDVLYFAHRILAEHPLIRAFLSPRFPYVLVDEFQDTNPVQTQVVTWLAESGSVVGVIGDPEQAIYGFQGARRQDFVDFALPGLRDYRIADNRRSTSPIVDLLNRVRTDQLEQKPLRKIEGRLIREVEGEPVRVFVGDAAKTIHHARSCLPSGTELHILARKNDEVARLRTETGTPSDDVWERFAKADHSRARFFEYLVTAVEAARRRNFTLAVRTLLRGLRVKNGELRKPLRYDRPLTELQRRGFAVALLESLITAYEDLCDEPVLEMYKRCDRACKGLSLQKIMENIERPSVVFRFTNETPYTALANTVTLSDETRTVRTMHNAKGAEFVSVLVWLGEGNESRLFHILDADDSDKEERRVTYVALSRARERLFISVPELTHAEEDALRKLGLEIRRV